MGRQHHADVTPRWWDKDLLRPAVPHPKMFTACLRATTLQSNTSQAVIVYGHRFLHLQERQMYYSMVTWKNKGVPWGPNISQKRGGSMTSMQDKYTIGK